jgi:hypothetical protein
MFAALASERSSGQVSEVWCVGCELSAAVSRTAGADPQTLTSILVCLLGRKAHRLDQVLLRLLWPLWAGGCCIPALAHSYPVPQAPCSPSRLHLSAGHMSCCSAVRAVLCCASHSRVVSWALQPGTHRVQVFLSALAAFSLSRRLCSRAEYYRRLHANLDSRLHTGASLYQPDVVFHGLSFHLVTVSCQGLRVLAHMLPFQYS